MKGATSSWTFHFCHFLFNYVSVRFQLNSVIHVQFDITYFDHDIIQDINYTIMKQGFIRI